MDEPSGLKMVAERWRSLAKEQKISAGILALCGVVALGLSVQRINASIRDPFTVSRAQLDQAKLTVNALDPAQQEEAAAKRRDTDGDGISDWDEQNVFHTSPYLRDTDGDGIPDNVEIAMVTNPNCATGKTCAAGQLDVSGLASSTDIFSNLPKTDSNQLFASFQRGINAQKQQLQDNGNTSTQLEQALVRDPAEIRKVLLLTGKIDQKTLDQVTDAQLLDLYDQVANQTTQPQPPTN